MILIILSLDSIANASELTFTMIDVGSAECLILVANGDAMIVDAGYAKSWNAIDEAIQSMDISTVSFFVITHPHADHIGSATKILENYEVETVLLPPITYDSEAYGRLSEMLINNKIDVAYPQVGDKYALGDACITVYGPHPVAYKNPNDWSIVLMVEYAGRRILLTGDVEAEAEYDLLAYSNQYPLDADILKVAHHGSNTSSTYEFVSAVSPQYAIISCASDADTEYPNIETAMNLFDCGTEDIFLTSTSGNITISIDSYGEMTITTEYGKH